MDDFRVHTDRDTVSVRRSGCLCRSHALSRIHRKTLRGGSCRISCRLSAHHSNSEHHTRSDRGHIERWHSRVSGRSFRSVCPGKAAMDRSSGMCCIVHGCRSQPVAEEDRYSVGQRRQELARRPLRKMERVVTHPCTGNGQRTVRVGTESSVQNESQA